VTVTASLGAPSGSGLAFLAPSSTEGPTNGTSTISTTEVDTGGIPSAAPVPPGLQKTKQNCVHHYYINKA
jgi:hypothetical protein